MLKIPCNCDEVFDNRVLIITGVGRSGTTILGKLIASMDPVYYLFEPAIMKYAHNLPPEIFKALLFEDYFLPLIQGRGNMNPADWSFQGNHMSEKQIEHAWSLSRREDAIKFIKEKKPLFVIKMPEYQHRIGSMFDTFTGLRCIDIIRNGHDVISSTVKRGWYTDEYCNTQMIDYLYSDRMCNIPMFLSKKAGKRWPGMDQATRAACVWRCLTQRSIDNAKMYGGRYMVVKYERFKEAPRAIAFELCFGYGVELTPLADKHIQSVKAFKPKETCITHDIDATEKQIFLKLMKDRGYDDTAR